MHMLVTIDEVRPAAQCASKGIELAAYLVSKPSGRQSMQMAIDQPVRKRTGAVIKGVGEVEMQPDLGRGLCCELWREHGPQRRLAEYAGGRQALRSQEFKDGITNSCRLGEIVSAQRKNAAHGRTGPEKAHNLPSTKVIAATVPRTINKATR